MSSLKIQRKLKSTKNTFILLSFLLISILSIGITPELSKARYELVYEFGPLLKGVPIQDIQAILIPLRFELLNSEDSDAYLMISPNDEDFILLRFRSDEPKESELSQEISSKVILRFKEEVDIFYRTQILLTQQIREKYIESLRQIEALNQSIPAEELILIQDYRSRQSLAVLQRRIENYKFRIDNYKAINELIQAKIQTESVIFHVEDRWVTLAISTIGLLVLGSLLNVMIILRLRKGWKAR